MSKVYQNNNPCYIYYDELLDPRELDLNDIQGKVFALDRGLYPPMDHWEFFEYVKAWIKKSGGIIDKKLDDKTDYLLLLDYGYEYDPETDDEIDEDEVPTFESDYIQWMHRLNKKGYGIKAICINDLYLHLKDSFVYFKERPNLSNDDVYMFQGNYLKYKGNKEEVDIPEGTLMIGEDAFCANEHIKGVYMPDSVYTTGCRCFKGCKNLSRVALSEKLSAIENSTFEDCTSLEKIVLPLNIKTISSYAFDRCSHLKKIVLPEGILRIGPEAFKDTDELQDINFPDSLVDISPYAFGWYHPLLSLYKNIKYIDDILINASEYTESELIIPDFIRRIAGPAFEDALLTSVDFNDSIEIVGCRAFCNCKELYEINTGTRLRVIGDFAFGNCSKLRKIVLNEKVETIGDEAFYNCKSLTKVFIYGKPEIGNDIFNGCEEVAVYCTPYNYEYLSQKLNVPCVVVQQGETKATKNFYEHMDDYLAEKFEDFDDNLFMEREEKRIVVGTTEVTVITDFADDFRRIRMLNSRIWYDMYEAMRKWKSTAVINRQREDEFYTPIMYKSEHMNKNATILPPNKANKRITFIKCIAYKMYDVELVKQILLKAEKDCCGNFIPHQRMIIATTGMVNRNNDIIELYAETLSENKVRICVKYKALTSKEINAIEKDLLSNKG